MSSDTEARLIEERVWGGFTRFTLNQPSTVKILHIRAGCSTSLQSHSSRDELWIALDDGLVAWIRDERRELQRGEEFLVPRGVLHRIESTVEGARILEISFGEFSEDDIVRYDAGAANGHPPSSRA